MKKIITVLLATIMLFTIVACAEESGKKNNGDEDKIAVEGKIWDKKDLDFGGYEFNILAQARTDSMTTRAGDDIDTEELTGNEVFDSVYYRNRLIETTYNCVIEHVVATDLKNTLLSGTEEDGNLVSHTIRNTFGLVEENLLLDLNDPSFSYLNLDKPWYSQTSRKDNTLAGKLFFLNGDMLFSDENGMWVTFFNKTLASRYITDADLYDLVRTGKWTLDTFMNYAALATAEVLADDKMDRFDQWGYAGAAPNVAALVTGSGWRYASVTEDGGIKVDMFEPDFQTVFKKCFETVDKRFCLLAQDIKDADQYPARDAVFEEGRALFLICGLSQVFDLREIETDFGILPLPKYDEVQPEYHTWTTYQTNVVSIPYTCTDPARTSAIMEALFEESSYVVRPAYIDKALKYQATRDDDSIEMLNIIIDSTVFDIGSVYDIGGMYTKLNNMVIARSIGMLSSNLKKAETPVNLEIADLIDRLTQKTNA